MKKAKSLMWALSEISLPRFNFEQACWFPTLDITAFFSLDNEEVKRCLWIEEMIHRTMFLPTETRLWMTWIEFLTNVEFMVVLEKVKKLQYSGAPFRLLIPLQLNLAVEGLPSDLKTRIENLVYASHLLSQLQSTCEPIVEAISIPALEENAHRRPQIKPFIDNFVQKKIEKYHLEEVYPKVVKLCQNTNHDYMGISYYVFGEFFGRIYRPPFTLSESFQLFNRKNYRNISDKFEQLLILFGQDVCNLNFHRFLKKAMRNWTTKETIKPLSRIISIVLEDITELAIKGIFDIEGKIDKDATKEDFSNMNSFVERAATPLFVPLALWRAIEKGAFEKGGIPNGYGSGVPALRIEEDMLTGRKTVTKMRIDATISKKVGLEHEIPYDDDYWASGLNFVYYMTVLKYFFLTNKWTRLMDKEKLDTYQVILEGLDYEICG